MIIEELWQRNQLSDTVAPGDFITWKDPDGFSEGSGKVTAMLPYSKKPNTTYGKHVYVAVDTTPEHVPLSWVVLWEQVRQEN